MSNLFQDILNKGKCSEAQYNQYKDLFDAAVKSGLISKPEKQETSGFSIGSERIETHYGYRWKTLDK